MSFEQLCSTDSPLPEAPDRRCEGVADLAARRARVSQSLAFTDGITARLTGPGHDDPAHMSASGKVRQCARCSRRGLITKGGRERPGSGLPSICCMPMVISPQPGDTERPVPGPSRSRSG